MEQRKEDVLIEILQNQVPSSKEEARHILKKHQYNLVSAINEIKGEMKKKGEYIEEVIYVSGVQLRESLKRILKQTNLVHLTILRNDRTLLSIPVTLSMIIFYLYPLISTLALAFFINKEYTIKVLKFKN